MQRQRNNRRLLALATLSGRAYTCRQGQRSAAPPLPHRLPHRHEEDGREFSTRSGGKTRFPQLQPWGVCSKNSLCPGPKERKYEPASLSILPALRTPARRSSPGREIAPQLPILWVSPFSRPQSCSGRPDRSRAPNPAGSAGSRTRLWPVGAARRLHGCRRTAGCGTAARGG